MSTYIPIHDDNVATTSVIQLQQEQLSEEHGGTYYGTITLVSARSRQEKSSNGQVLKNMYKNYMNCLEEKPLETKMLTVGSVSFLSDSTAQLLQGTGVTDLDVYRSFTMFLIGFFLTAPMYHVLYGFLEKKFPMALKTYNRYIQLAVDQLIAIPLWTLAFIILISILRGNWSVSFILNYIQQQFISILLTSWIIYPVLQFINFSYVPSNKRVLMLTGISFVFTVLVSFLTSGDSADETEQHIAHLIIIPYT